MKGVHDYFDWKCTILRIFGTKNVCLVTCCEPVVESSSTKACTQVRGWNGFPAILAAKGWYEVYMRNLMSTGMKQAREPTLDLKPKEDFIKSSKYSYQWLHKKDSNVLQIKKKCFPLADLRGAPGTRPPGSKFFHFHAVFGEKIEK